MMRITPFGDNTFLYDDVRREFIQYYVHLKHALMGDASLAYSRTKGMGGSMFGLFINYMSSPLNLIYVLFPVKAFPTVLTILIIFRMGLSAFTADVFLGHLNLRHTVAFSVSFAMSLWVFVSILNPLWLDAIIMFPLLSTAVLEFSKDTRSVKKLLVLVLLTAVQFYLNYYTACMMMIFFAIWMILRWLLKVISFSDGLRVATGLITGILLICPVIYPVYKELTLSEKSVGGSFISNIFKDAYITNPIMVLSKLFTCSIDGSQVMFGMPHLFCGTIMIPLLVYFFLNKSLDKKLKKQCAFLLGILFISFCLSPLDLVWHAGNIPNGYPYRYAFIFVAVMITCCAYSFNIILDQGNGSGNTVPSFTCIMASFAITGALELLVVLLSFVIKMPWLSYKYGLVGIVLLGIECAISAIYFYKNKKVFIIILALVCMGDLMINQVKIVRAAFIPCEPLSEYQTRYDDKSIKIANIKADDDSFYRIEDIESNPYDNMNDSMVYSYHGISHYSTGDHKSVRMFLKDIGFNYNELFDQYADGNTYCANSILNIKYLLVPGGTVQNQSIFPAAVILPDDIYIPSEETIDDPFTFQMEIASTFAGMEKDISDTTTSENDLFVPAKINDMSIDQREDNDTTIMTIDLTSKSDGCVYFYLQGLKNINQNMCIYVNDTFISGYGNASAIKIVNLGSFNEGAQITLKIEAYGDPEEADFGTPLIFTENMEVLSDYCKKASERAVTVTEISPTKLGLSISDTDSIPSENNNILISIPYEEGFSAKSFDGQKEFVVRQSFGALTLIEIPEGYTGDIVLVYNIPGVNIGFMLLIIGIIMLLIQYKNLKNHKFI